MRTCFACGKKLGRNPYHASTSDGQSVEIGSECIKKIGPDGYQPPQGGPRLFLAKFQVDGFVWHVTEIKTSKGWEKI
jgi:hypothetical protein